MKNRCAMVLAALTLLGWSASGCASKETLEALSTVRRSIRQLEKDITELDRADATDAALESIEDQLAALRERERQLEEKASEEKAAAWATGGRITGHILTGAAPLATLLGGPAAVGIIGSLGAALVNAFGRKTNAVT